MPNPLRRKRNSPAEEHQPTLTPFEVHITESGDCTIGALPLVSGDNEALHDSVLNHLHRLAMATGHPVRATVHDGRSGYITPIEVLTDGSSQFAGEPESMPRSEPSPSASFRAASTAPSAPAPPVASSSPMAHAPADPAPPPHTGTDSPHEGALPSAPPQEDEARAWPELSESKRASGGPPPVVADAVTRINQALEGGHVEFAAMTGQHSLASATQDFGPDHPHVLELQELCAHVAYVAGDVTRSMATALEVARARQRLGDPRAYESLMRAAAVWSAIHDPREGLELGRDLVSVWSALAREGGQAAAEIGKLDAAKRRMVRLAQRASEMGTSQNPPGATGHGPG